MRTNKEIIDRIIGTACRLERARINRNELKNACFANTESAIEARENELLDLDFEINSCGAELNILCWLFEDKNNNLLN